ncbi:MAG: hypothetical protein KQA34_00135 [Candidatus Aenigmarchaeota archaeon]|nr:hypothetical protein [Candidatus Aenigmarchaeota archaeon]
MIVLSKIKKVKEISDKKELKELNETSLAKPLERPYVIDARVYKLKSRFVKHSVFVTIGYIKDGNKVRPFEIFLNSKDLTKAAEFVILTRLLSAIFRRTEDPTFILEELRSVYDPNGTGYFKNGKYIASFYGELAEILEEFFTEMGMLEKEKKEENKILDFNIKEDINDKFQICPKCGMKTLKVEEGCYTCINPECGYTKCN